MMKKIFYVLYRYYKNGPTQDVAYLKSLLLILFFLFINLLTLLAFLNVWGIFEFADNSDKMTKYILLGGGYFFPGYLILSRIVKKEDLTQPQLEREYKNIHGLLMVLYCLLSVVLAVVAMKYFRK